MENGRLLTIKTFLKDNNIKRISLWNRVGSAFRASDNIPVLVVSWIIKAIVGSRKKAERLSMNRAHIVRDTTLYGSGVRLEKIYKRRTPSWGRFRPLQHHRSLSMLMSRFLALLPYGRFALNDRGLLHVQASKRAHQDRMRAYEVLNSFDRKSKAIGRM